MGIGIMLELGLILIGIMLVLGIIGYFVVAYMYNGKYCVVFEMDDNGIMHAQQDKQVKKAKLIGIITAMSGAARGNIGAVGTGILAASRTKMYTDFKYVKSIDVDTNSNLIKLNATLDRNQVYVENEDFDFVLKYIAARCPNAKAK